MGQEEKEQADGWLDNYFLFTALSIDIQAQALELKKEGKTVKQIAEIPGKSKSAIGRWLKAA